MTKRKLTVSGVDHVVIGTDDTLQRSESKPIEWEWVLYSGSRGAMNRSQKDDPNFSCVLGDGPYVGLE